MQPRLNGFVLLNENGAKPYIALAYDGQRDYLLPGRDVNISYKITDARHMTFISDILRRSECSISLGGPVLENNFFPAVDVSKLELLAVGAKEKIADLQKKFSDGTITHKIVSDYNAIFNLNPMNLQVARLPFFDDAAGQNPDILDYKFRFVFTKRNNPIKLPIELRILSKEGFEEYQRVEMVNKRIVLLGENGPAPILQNLYPAHRAYLFSDKNRENMSLMHNVLSRLSTNMYLGGEKIEQYYLTEVNHSLGIDCLAVSTSDRISSAINSFREKNELIEIFKAEDRALHAKDSSYEPSTVSILPIKDNMEIRNTSDAGMEDSRFMITFREGKPFDVSFMTPESMSRQLEIGSRFRIRN